MELTLILPIPSALKVFPSFTRTLFACLFLIFLFYQTKQKLPQQQALLSTTNELIANTEKELQEAEQKLQMEAEMGSTIEVCEFCKHTCTNIASQMHI